MSGVISTRGGMSLGWIGRAQSGELFGTFMMRRMASSAVRTAAWAMITASSRSATSASAWVISIGASVPTRTLIRFWSRKSLASCSAARRVLRLRWAKSRSQYAFSAAARVSMTVCRKRASVAPSVFRDTMMRERLALAPRLRSRGCVKVRRYEVLNSWEALAGPAPSRKEESLSSPFRSTE
jgi:hypothetical protein